MNEKNGAHQPEEEMDEGASILVVDDDEAMRFFLKKKLGRLGYIVRAESGGDDALAVLANSDWDVVLLDIKMPGRSGIEILSQVLASPSRPRVIMMTGYSSRDAAAEAMRLGASEYIEKPFTHEAIRDVVARVHADLVLEREGGRSESGGTELEPTSVLGWSAPMVALRNEMDKIARSDLPVLIRGERGTEKERIARAIHSRSAFRNGPLVVTDCRSLATPIAATEPATLFEKAAGGSLFFDGLGAMPAAFQSKLMQILEDEKRRCRNHDNGRFPPNLRLIASAGEDLDDAIEIGRFREDLYFMIGVLPLHIPPLRERPGDPSCLATILLREIAGPKVKFKREVFPCLENYDWPRNVWELRNVVERGAALNKGPRIGRDSLPQRIRESTSKKGHKASGSGAGV